MSTKTIAIVGATGNQGGSVVNAFVNDPEWKIRGLTRNPSKPSPLKEQGVELVAAELDDVDSLKKAFAGAQVIFGTTDFWQHMANPEVQALAKERNVTPNEIAYEREVQQGKNIVDAAASTVSSLERFVLCTLTDSKYWSKGKVTFNLHFDAKWKAVEYCKEKYPELWEKTSLLQLGVFASNWKSGQAVPRKQDDGSYVLSTPMSGSAKFPMVDPNADTGKFVRALLTAPPNTNLMGCGSKLSWDEYCAIWGRVNNVKCTFSRMRSGFLEQIMGSAGKELDDMFLYIDEFGYDGSDPSVVYPWDLKEKVEYTTMEEYIAKQDWSSVL